MALTIISPRNSFVRFGESDILSGCGFDDVAVCLPVYTDNDVAFQFIIQGDTEAEADLLCDLSNSQIHIGIVESCDQNYLLEFSGKTARRRISPTQVLYMWSGLPGFATVISVGECFRIKIITSQSGNEYEACSNCFIRIGDPCWTSVLDYSGDNNQFGFNYCGGADVGGAGDGQQQCDPTIIAFTNETTLTIPYTAGLQAKYGDVPTVSVWIRDTDGKLAEMGVRITFDDFPPSVIGIDCGGPASGIVKIS